MRALDVPLQPIVSEPELVISWLAQRGMVPTKTEWGRYTIREGNEGSTLSLGAKLLIVDNLGIHTDDDLASVRHEIETHPRWTGESEPIPRSTCF